MQNESQRPVSRGAKLIDRVGKFIKDDVGDYNQQLPNDGTTDNKTESEKPKSRSASEPPKSSPEKTEPSLKDKKQNRGASLPKTPKITNIITKFSFATKGGISSHNPFKVNQDAYITSPHIMGLRHCHFFSVCDGHGSNGREVSSLLKHRLPL